MLDRRHAARAASAFATLVLVLVPSAVPLAAADEAPLATALLPSPRGGMSAVWTGDGVLALGGRSDSWNVYRDVLRYDPGLDEVTTLAQLPVPRHGAAIAWDGAHAYLFGGHDGSTNVATVLRFDPASGATESMGAALPTARRGAIAVWDPRDFPASGCPGGCAYVFGGGAERDGVLGLLDEVVRYNPSTDSADVVARLPSARSGVAAAFDGEAAYLFGGDSWPAPGGHAEVLRFDPVDASVDVLDARLPSPRLGASAVWDGERALVLGGWDGERALDEVLAFDPRADSVVALPRTLPGGRFLGPAVWTGEEAIFPGGLTSTWTARRDIVRYEARLPGPPQDVEAAPGENVGAVRVEWSPPQNPGAAPVSAYRVYRAGADGEESRVAEVGADVLALEDEVPSLLESYRYRVAAVNAAGEGRPSALVCAAPAPWPAPAAPPAARPCPAPDGYREDVILARDLAVGPTPGNVPRVPQVGVAAGPREGDSEWFDAAVLVDGRPVSPVGVRTGDLGLPAAGAESPPVDAPTEVPAVGRHHLIVRVAQRHDPSLATCAVTLGATCLLRLPLDPLDPEGFADGGAAGGLLVEARLEGPSGDVVAHVALLVPYAGQLLARTP